MANKTKRNMSPQDEQLIKELQLLIAKGKKQGYLTYDEINDTLPDALLTPDRIDETLARFESLKIEVSESAGGPMVDAAQKKSEAKKDGKTEGKLAKKSTTRAAPPGDYGSVTDPVKMYLREMGRCGTRRPDRGRGPRRCGRENAP